MDAQVAERLFGFEVACSDGDLHMLYGYLDNEPRDWADQGEPYVVTASGHDCRISAYSTTWRGAGEVIEEMQRRYYEVDVEGHPSGEWLAIFWWRRSPDPIAYSGTGESFPEAVARAALKALEAE